MTALDVLALLDDRPRDAVSVLGLLPEEEADAKPLARGLPGARGDEADQPSRRHLQLQVTC